MTEHPETSVGTKLWQLRVFLDAAGLHEQASIASAAIEQLAAQPVADGLPERKNLECTGEYFYEARGFNECLDAVTPLVARLEGDLVTAQKLQELTESNVYSLLKERDALKAEVERLKGLPHGQILAESAGRHLLNSGAENFVGEVFAIEADDGTTKFEIVVTTQKVGAKSPGEVCNELQSELTKARELLAEFCDRVEKGEVRSKSTYAKFKAFLAKQSAPAAKGG